MKRLSTLAALLTMVCGLGGCVSSFKNSSATPPSEVQRYLEDWQPQLSGQRESWPAHRVVAKDGSGTHTSLQAAIDSLPLANTAHDRTFILIKPGEYREIVCAKDKAPFTLYARGNAKDVVIIESRYNAQIKAAGQTASACYPLTQDTSYGTFGSTTMAVHANDVQLVGFTVANDSLEKVKAGQNYPVGAGESGGAQGVALSLKGDRIHLKDMRLIGHQDTLFTDRAGPVQGRVYVENSLIAGDVDFIFGGARLVIDQSFIVSRAGRRTPGNGGHVLAPSTAPQESLGFLVIRSQLLGQAGLPNGSISLGRAWDFGVKRGEWRAGTSPNGEATITQSQLGAHFGEGLAGWGRSTSGREPTYEGPQAMRMREFGNARVNSSAPQELP
jgi:pectin methylesterase-like acyl-CoA thioesterase